jgi:hypothetical protein
LVGVERGRGDERERTRESEREKLGNYAATNIVYYDLCW